jgi:hypothetical protein
MTVAIKRQQDLPQKVPEENISINKSLENV